MSAAAGSPRKSMLILSTSSRRKTGIPRPGPLDHLDDPAGIGADVRPAVAPDLGLVPDAAEREADEFPAGGPGDGLASELLPDAGRADQAEDDALGVLDELADGEVFEDALLDLLQAVMVLVQDALGVLEIPLLARFLHPGQGDQPVEVIAADRRLGRHRRHRFEPLDLLAGLVRRVRAASWPRRPSSSAPRARCLLVLLAAGGLEDGRPAAVEGDLRPPSRRTCRPCGAFRPEAGRSRDSRRNRGGCRPLPAVDRSRGGSASRRGGGTGARR